MVYTLPKNESGEKTDNTSTIILQYVLNSLAISMLISGLF